MDGDARPEFAWCLAFTVVCDKDGVGCAGNNGMGRILGVCTRTGRDYLVYVQVGIAGVLENELTMAHSVFLSELTKVDGRFLKFNLCSFFALRV